MSSPSSDSGEPQQDPSGFTISFEEGSDGDWTDDEEEVDFGDLMRVARDDQIINGDFDDEEDDDDDYEDDDDEEEDDEDQDEADQVGPRLSDEALRILAALPSSASLSVLQQLRAIASNSNAAAGGQPRRRRRYLDEDDSEEDDPNDTDPRSASARWYPLSDKSTDAGLALRFGGEFGGVGKRKRAGVGGIGGLIWDREKGGSGGAWGGKAEYAKACVPNTHGTTVASLTAPPYSGQYSSDSEFFYTATKDFRLSFFSTSTSPSVLRPAQYMQPATSSIRQRRFNQIFGTMYDDDDDESSTGAGGARVGETSLLRIKEVKGIQQGWTVTDADLGKEDEWMIYSSMTPEVQMFNTRDTSDEQVTLDFSSRSSSSRRGGRYQEDLRIWSVRFSADGKEIVAGASESYEDGKLIVFDIEAEKPILNILAHQNDVNSVCWADKASKHLLCSASDDGYVKVWDRRSLASGKPSGVLVGHTEGVTSLSPKGDGRYVISNGKDQTVRLWDLRNMAPPSTCEDIPDSVAKFGTGYDYRNGYYPKPRYEKAAGDCSVTTYRGHSVVRTLIRCHFAPPNSTGQQYVYSGSADGRIHIWHLDGRIAQVLDRRLSSPLVDTEREAAYVDPSAADDLAAAGSYGPAALKSSRRGLSYCVRDVSWHGYKPEIMSSAWDPSGRGSVARHEWKGFGKHGMTIPDVLEREAQEASR